MFLGLDGPAEGVDAGADELALLGGPLPPGLLQLQVGFVPELMPLVLFLQDLQVLVADVGLAQLHCVLQPAPFPLVLALQHFSQLLLLHALLLEVPLLFVFLFPAPLSFHRLLLLLPRDLLV